MKIKKAIKKVANKKNKLKDGQPEASAKNQLGQESEINVLE